MAPIMVRHGLSLPDAKLPSDDWALDPRGLNDIEALAAVLPKAPVICSDMRRAIDTAAYLGDPVIDTRLAEVSRPFVADPKDDFAIYLAGGAVDGWEPHSSAIARIEECLAEHGDAIYVTHGTILTLLMKSRYPELDAPQFWGDLRNPDAWLIKHPLPTRVLV